MRNGHGDVRPGPDCERGPQQALRREGAAPLHATGHRFNRWIWPKLLNHQTTPPGREEAEYEMPLMWIPGRRGSGLLHQLWKRRGTSAQHTRCGSADHARSARAVVTAHPDATTWTHRAATGLRGPGPTSTPTGRTGGSPRPRSTNNTDTAAWTRRSAAGLRGTSRTAARCNRGTRTAGTSTDTHAPAGTGSGSLSRDADGRLPCTTTATGTTTTALSDSSRPGRGPDAHLHLHDGWSHHLRADRHPAAHRRLRRGVLEDLGHREPALAWSLLHLLGLPHHIPVEPHNVLHGLLVLPGNEGTRQDNRIPADQLLQVQPVHLRDHADTRHRLGLVRHLGGVR